MQHPVPYGPKTCSDRHVESRIRITIPVGEHLAMFLNPQLAFLTKVQPDNVSGLAGSPQATTPVYYTTAPVNTSDPTGATEVSLNYSYPTAAERSNGTGWKRWLGTEVRVRQVSTTLNQGGSVYWTDGRTGRGLLGWNTANGGGAWSTVGEDTLTAFNTASSYPLNNQWSHFRAVPSTPEDHIFTDIPESMCTYQKTGLLTNEVIIPHLDVMPDVAGDVANDGWRQAVHIVPADASIENEVELIVVMWFETHWIAPSDTTAFGLQPREIPQTADTKSVNSHPAVAALHSNAMERIGHLLNNGGTAPVKTSSLADGFGNLMSTLGRGAAGAVGAAIGNFATGSRRSGTRSLTDRVAGFSLDALEDAAAVGATGFV